MTEGTLISSAELGINDAPQSRVLNLRQVRDAAEKQAVIRALGCADRNISKTAEMLGVSRPTLYELLDRFALRD